MYCAANGNLIYPAFQNNLKAENFNNNNNIQPDFNDMKKFTNKKMINEDNNNSNNTNNFNNNNNNPDLFQKNILKNTYMKKINSLFSQNSADSLKLLQENNNQQQQFFLIFLFSDFL